MLQSLNQKLPNQEEATSSNSTTFNQSTTISPSTLTPTPNPSPTLKVSQTPYPAPECSFGPKGYFRIISPTANCDGNNLTLTITGEAINEPLTMTYSTDGKNPIPFSAVVKQEHDWDIFVGRIVGSTTLPPLSLGAHSITVYGTLSGVSAQATTYFTCV